MGLVSSQKRNDMSSELTSGAGTAVAVLARAAAGDEVHVVAELRLLGVVPALLLEAAARLFHLRRDDHRIENVR